MLMKELGIIVGLLLVFFTLIGFLGSSMSYVNKQPTQISQGAATTGAYVKSERLRIVCYQYRTYYDNFVSTCLQLDTENDLVLWKEENGL